MKKALSILEVKKKHEARILMIEGVSSVGIGLNKDKEQVIVVGLYHETEESSKKIPSELEGYAVEIRITGQIKARMKGDE